MSADSSTAPYRPENRQLKIAGMALFALATPLINWLSELKADEFVNGGPWKIVSTALVYLLAGNLFALGLIALLAGFRSLPILTDAKAKRGAIVKLLGGNLLIICFGLVAINDYVDRGDFGEAWKDSWLIAPAIVIFLWLARKGSTLVRTGWKYDAVSAAQALAEDHRAPVVYVRSFRDDQKMIVVDSRIRRLFAALFEYLVAISPEQELAMIMNRIGPLVAIGKPGEPLPELGAARFYVADDQWQDKITDLMQQAKLVVVRVGGTANLQWEIDRALALLPLQRVVFFFLGVGKETEPFARELEQRFGPIEKLASSAKLGVLSKWSWLVLPQGFDLGKVVYFSADQRPRVEPIRFALSWKLVYLTFLRPYAVPLGEAFRHVFAQLDLPWVERKRRSTAALLALFGGMFGLHEFYLGHRRRGVYCLVFFWTMIPFFMGWIDAIKFALLDEQEFQRRFIDAQGK